MYVKLAHVISFCYRCVCVCRSFLIYANLHHNFNEEIFSCSRVVVVVVFVVFLVISVDDDETKRLQKFSAMLILYLFSLSLINRVFKTTQIEPAREYEYIFMKTV